MSDVPIRIVEGYLFDGVEYENGTAFRREAPLPPGSAQWSTGQDGNIASLLFICPCGCGAVGAVPVASGYGRSAWTWNGSKDKPTLRPSIQKLSPCRWHGYLTDGVFRRV